MNEIVEPVRYDMDHGMAPVAYQFNWCCTQLSFCCAVAFISLIIKSTPERSIFYEFCRIVRNNFPLNGTNVRSVV